LESDSPARTARYHQLDALRGLGCLAVMWIHGAWLPGQLTPAGRSVIAATHTNWLAMHTGQAAVEMFFVMSAFLLWRPFTAAAQNAAGDESVRAYALRRVARIVPGYWAALVLIALWQATPHVLSAHTGGRYFVFTQNLHSATALGGIGPAWTLAVEAQFYVLLGVLALARRRGGRTVRFDLVLAGVMAAGAAVWRLAVIGPTDHLTRAHLDLVLSLPAHLDSFAVGIALAAVTVRYELTPGRAGRWVHEHPTVVFGAGCALFAGGVLALGLHSPFAITRTQYLLRAWLYVAVAVCLVAPFAFTPHHTGLAHRLLGRRGVVNLGRWSFGAYLWHMAVFGRLGTAGLSMTTTSGFVVTFAAGVTISFALGAVSWLLLERPLVRLAHRYHSRAHLGAADPVTPPGAPAPQAA
jgi:peptidoglycan/LPS O-acetylase OafA/YrhL